MSIFVCLFRKIEIARVRLNFSYEKESLSYIVKFTQIVFSKNRFIDQNCVLKMILLKIVCGSFLSLSSDFL